MALPSTDRFRRPTLQALSGGAPTTNEPVHDRVQKTLEISDEDRAYVPPTSNNSTFTNRIAFAFVYLQERKLIEKTSEDPNTYKITELGERALADGLDLSAISPRATPPLDLPQAAPEEVSTGVRVWLIRAGREGRYEQLALDQEVSLIGWGELGDIDPEASRDDLKAAIEQAYGEASRPVWPVRLVRFIDS
jgi:Mrr N-terminal domain